MSETEQWIVGDFLFSNGEDAKMASEEEKKIEYLEGKMDYTKPSIVLAVYQKLLESNIFQTPVGWHYLCKLREYLVKNLNDTEIPTIKAPETPKRKLREETEAVPIKTRVKKTGPVKKKKTITFKMSLLWNFILLLIIIVMFIITLNGTTPNIMNYEKVLVDRYASWEQELTDREAAVREKEREFTNLP